MLPPTLDAVRALLRTDPSLNSRDRSRLVATLQVHGESRNQTPTELAEEAILTRGVVAARFGRSKRFVDKLAASGALHRVRLPGRKRACGFRRTDVDRLLNSVEVRNEN